jgi:hypothetical protein
MITIKFTIVQNTFEKKKFNKEKTTAGPAVAVSKPRAMSCEFTCSQSSSLIAQNTFEKKKFNKDKTTTRTGSGRVQAQGHEL